MTEVRKSSLGAIIEDVMTSRLWSSEIGPALAVVYSIFKQVVLRDLRCMKLSAKA
jgi:hypothetical protein